MGNHTWTHKGHKCSITAINYPIWMSKKGKICWSWISLMISRSFWIRTKNISKIRTKPPNWTYSAKVWLGKQKTRPTPQNTLKWIQVKALKADPSPPQNPKWSLKFHCKNKTLEVTLKGPWTNARTFRILWPVILAFKTRVATTWILTPSQTNKF